MSEIQFKKLSIENFLSIGEGSIDLDNRGLLLIQGQNNDDSSANSNGSGKSSVVDALCWALYGTTARGKSGDGVVNRFEGKGCRVEVKFHFDGKEYVVTRHRKHKTGKNRLTFTCDGDDLTLGTDKLTQELIERTIGCNQEVFTASIYSGQNNMPELPAMTDKELKQLVERAAGIELLDAAYEIAREEARAVSASVALQESHLKGAVQAEAEIKASIGYFEGAVEHWGRERKAKLAQLGVELAAHMESIREKKALLDDFDEAEARQKVKELEEALKAASVKDAPPVAPEPPATPLRPAEPLALRELQRSFDRAESETGRLSGELRNIVDAAKNLNKRVGEPCGECGKKIEEGDLKAHRDSLKLKAATTKTALDAAKRELEVIGEKRSFAALEHEAECLKIETEAASLIAAYQEEREVYKNALETYRDKLKRNDTSELVDALRDAQRALQTHSTNVETLKRLMSEAFNLRKQHDELKSATNPNEEALASATERLKAREEATGAIREALDLLIKTAADMGLVSDLFSPKGMRGEMLDSVTPFLNDRTSQYLGALSDGNISAEWKTVAETTKGELREKFHISVTNDKGDDDYMGLSGGEQRKVRISTAMALQDLVASRADRPIKLFIADEADDALDVSGLERLMGVLDEKARSVGTVLVISHNDLADWIPNTLTVLKSGGKSSIIEL